MKLFRRSKCAVAISLQRNFRNFRLTIEDFVKRSAIQFLVPHLSHSASKFRKFSLASGFTVTSSSTLVFLDEARIYCDVCLWTDSFLLLSPSFSIFFLDCCAIFSMTGRIVRNYSLSSGVRFRMDHRYLHPLLSFGMNNYDLH